MAPRSGNVLIEFAFVALILYLLLAVTFDFGRAIYSAQILQQAADTGARELSRTPLPANPPQTLRDVLANSTLQQVYSEDYLVINSSMLGGLGLVDYFANKPVLNRLLMPLMVTQQVDSQTLIHYPGQLVADTARPSGYTVIIPMMQYGGGTESFVKNVPVVEEISSNPTDDPFSPNPSNSPFNLTASGVPAAQRGMIALRINYPYQAASLTSFSDNKPVEASDADGTFGPYAGPRGLGQQAAFAGKTVRPFRKVLSAQAIYRREIFQ